MFSVIAKVRHVEDGLTGNFMGLNPYFKFLIANTTKTLEDNWPVVYWELEGWQVEETMREAYMSYSPTRSIHSLLPDIYVTTHLERVWRAGEINSMIENDTINF